MTTSASHTGVSGDGFNPVMVTQLATSIKDRLAVVQAAMAGTQKAVVLAQLESLAGMATYNQIANLYLGTNKATAILQMIGPKTTEMRVTQEGPNRALLGASEAAAVLTNHILAWDGSVNPAATELITSFLQYATTVTAALAHPNNDRWSQLEGNLAPEHLDNFGSPTKAVVAAITLLSCQTAIEAQLLPQNFQGVSIPARFEAVSLAAAQGRRFSELAVAQFIHHASGIAPITGLDAANPPATLEVDAIRLAVYSAPHLSNVFRNHTVRCTALGDDAVYNKMFDASGPTPRVEVPIYAAAASGFDPAAPAFNWQAQADGANRMGPDVNTTPKPAPPSEFYRPPAKLAAARPPALAPVQSDAQWTPLQPLTPAGGVYYPPVSTASSAAASTAASSSGSPLMPPPYRPQPLDHLPPIEQARVLMLKRMYMRNIVSGGQASELNDGEVEQAFDALVARGVAMPFDEAAAREQFNLDQRRPKQSPLAAAFSVTRTTSTINKPATPSVPPPPAVPRNWADSD
jgi:hypothetical protein